MTPYEIAVNWSWLVGAVPVAVLLFAWRSPTTDPSALRRKHALTFAIVAVGALLDVQIAVRNITGQTEWDQLAFWLSAAGIVQGLDPWQANALDQVALPFKVSPQFRGDVIEGGFLHPPTGLLPYLWMGVLPYRAAVTLWYLLLGGGLVLLARRLGRVPVHASGEPIGPWTVAALMLTMLPTHTAVSNAQTAPLVVLCLAVALQLGDRFPVAVSPGWRQGAALGAATILKPYAILVAWPWVVARCWRALFGTGAALAASSLLTTALLGPGTWSSWLDRVGRVANRNFTEEQNQSSSGMLARLFDVDPSNLPLHPFVLACGVVWAVAAASLAWREGGGRHGFARRSSEDWRWHGVMLTTMTGALWLYPGTLKHYLMALLPVVVWLLALVPFSQRASTLARGAIVAVFAALTWKKGIYAGLALPWVWLAMTCVLFAYPRSAER